MSHRFNPFLLACVLCACSSGAEQTLAKGGGPPVAKVKVEHARHGSLTSDVRFMGNVQSALSTPIASAVAGTVRDVPVHPGQAVAKGALLVALDARRVRAELLAAEATVQRTRAQLAQAERQAERVTRSQAALSAPEREGYQLQVAILKAQVASEAAQAARVRVDVAYHRVTAPFAGVLKSRQVNPGAWVQSGQGLVELVSMEQLEVLVDVPFDVGRELSVGDGAEFFHGQQNVAATIAGIVPALDAVTRTMRIRLEVAETTPKWLIPGLAVDVRLQVAIEQGGGLLVPRDAIIRGPVENRVLKVQDGVGISIPVTILGASDIEALVIGAGLSAGDAVMTRGNERYRPGTPVLVLDSES